MRTWKIASRMLWLYSLPAVAVLFMCIVAFQMGPLVANAPTYEDLDAISGGSVYEMAALLDGVELVKYTSDWWKAVVFAAIVLGTAGVTLVFGVTWHRHQLLHPLRRVVTVYHGTRVTLSTIVNYGIVGLDKGARRRLMMMVASEMGGLGISVKVKGAGTGESGVFVTDKYEEARPFALMAPHYVSHAIYRGLRRQKVAKADAHYITYGALERIGAAKILRCQVDVARLKRGAGSFGSMVDALTPDDIEEITVIGYAKPREALGSVPDAIWEILAPVWKWWGGSEKKEVQYVQGC